MVQSACATMPSDPFADVAHQPEEVSSQIEPGQRSCVATQLAAHMRLGIVETDRLAREQKRS
jgi:hypothetical protein